MARSSSKVHNIGDLFQTWLACVRADSISKSLSGVRPDKRVWFVSGTVLRFLKICSYMLASRYKLFALLILALVVGEISLAANQASPEMVILNVRVTDARSHAVVDVPQDNFKIFEDGIE